MMGGIAVGRRMKSKPVTLAGRGAGRSPAQTVHDRKSRDLPINSVVGVTTVVDSAGDRLEVFRSLRDDPLASMHHAGSIDQAQFTAGRHLQRCYELAEVGGGKAIDPTKEAVDGGGNREPGVTDQQIKAFADIQKADKALGIEGAAIVRDILGDGLSLKRAALRRGFNQADDAKRYMGRRFRECLETLAVLWGYAGRARSVDKSDDGT